MSLTRLILLRKVNKYYHSVSMACFSRMQYGPWDTWSAYCPVSRTRLHLWAPYRRLRYSTPLRVWLLWALLFVCVVKTTVITFTRHCLMTRQSHCYLLLPFAEMSFREFELIVKQTVAFLSLQQTFCLVFNTEYLFNIKEGNLLYSHFLETWPKSNQFQMCVLSSDWLTALWTSHKQVDLLTKC